VRAFTSIGSEPAIMLTAPADAARKVLARAGMTAKDIDLFEINEAFASVVLALHARAEALAQQGQCERRRHRNGHPLGATGAMILGTGARRAGAAQPYHRMVRCASAPAWARRPLWRV
jgi:acetyl-CoA C-acetyltransferase